MNLTRENQLDQLAADELWDVLVIGGGATGLGVAVDSASRGYRTLLLEQSDFAKGTSSRSTKLVHGGIRYLRQGNISLVMEALRERGLLCVNAPHLVHHLPFIVPIYTWWEGPFYGIGTKLYDQLAGQLGLEPSQSLSREETVRRLPTLETDGLRRGVVYYDGQFDDARLAIHLALTATDHGACVLNYVKVVGLIQEQDLTHGVRARDEETGAEWELRARVVINATGVYTDAIRQLDDSTAPPVVTASQGTHLVLPRAFHPGDSAIMIPHTSDGRVLFAVPWHDHVVVGTTDVGVTDIPLEPRPLAEELDFLLSHSARYLMRDPSASDVLSVFSGLRPLVSAGSGTTSTAALSRDHTVLVSASGLISVTGGKWTTYRKMAEDTLDVAEQISGIGPAPCVTKTLPIHGATTQGDAQSWRGVYGEDATHLAALEKEQPDWAAPLHPDLPYTGAEVVWAVRAEYARTLEDVLARRTRALFLNARAAIAMAPAVASLMAMERDWDETETQRQIEVFTPLARGYLIEAAP